MPLFLWSAPFTSLYGGPSGDFGTFHQAGRVWLGQGNPYNQTGRAAGFIYPPTSLPFYGAFALFDFRFASQLWVIAYFSVFVGALLSLALTIEGERRYVFVSIAIVLLLTSYPLLFLMQWGQSDLLVAGLAIISLVCERLKHRSVSAVLLSIATLLKGPAFLLLIYFVLFRRDLRYLTHFLISTLVIVGASLFVVPIGLYWYYVANVVPALLSVAGNWSLAGMSKISSVASIAGIGLFAAFSFWAGSKNFPIINQKTLPADAMFLMTVLVTLQVNPRSADYQYVWIILPLALFLSALLMEQVKMKYVMLVGFTTFLLNSVLSPDFLNYAPFPRPLPLEIIGNLMLTLSLIPIFIHPTTIMQLKMAHTHCSS
jgi:hypothetical protein